MLWGNLSYTMAKYEFTEKSTSHFQHFFINMQLTIKYKTLAFKNSFIKTHCINKIFSFGLTLHCYGELELSMCIYRILYYSVIICISERNAQEEISIHNNILDY